MIPCGFKLVDFDGRGDVIALRTPSDTPCDIIDHIDGPTVRY
jgi:hypothetical protein